MKIAESKNKWDKTVQLELTLKEVQILRDSLAHSTDNNMQHYWINSDKPCPYTSDEIYRCYQDINKLTTELGGNDFDE